MALTFPLTNFIEAFFVAQCSFTLEFDQQMSQKGDGTIIVKDLSPELWNATLTSARLRLEKALLLQSKINALRGGARLFWAWNPKAPYPQSDPNGTIVGSSAVKIHTIDAGLETIRLKDLPAGYALKAGDFLAFTYSSTFNALHQLAEDATADGSGITPLFTVTPAIRAGAAVNDAVNLKKPACTMCILPKTASIQASDRVWATVSCQARQVLSSA